MPATAINSYDEFKTLIKGDKPIVIDFWATWCGPCRVISPIFEKLADNHPALGFYKVDVDEQEQIAAEVGIRAMPTFAVFHKGNKIDELVGANPGGLETLLAKGASL
jgi:thioredoxin 1